MEFYMIRAMALLILLPTSASADIPYTFSAGTPAKASEVNENFSSLNSDIESTNSRLTDLEKNYDLIGSSCQNTISWWLNKHEISYEPKPSTTGQTLSYGGNTYRIVKISFREFKSGDEYHIKFPAKERESGHISGNIYTQHSTIAENCSNLMISGYPAYSDGTTERRSISFYNNGITESKSYVTFFYSINIKIGETNLSISMSIEEDEITALVSPGNYDFTNHLDTNNMSHKLNLLSNIDSLIDYIEIEKIP